MTHDSLFYRATASVALQGKWPVAALAAFVYALIGGNVVSSLWERLEPALDASNAYGLIIAIGIVLIIYCVAAIILNGAIRMGYAMFNLKLIDGKEVSVKDLFSQLHRIGDGLVMQLLTAIFLILWSLLLIVPGIIKSFAYSMAPYILLEHPDFSGGDAITRSKELMDGNKARLFRLKLSFIGWLLLAAVPAFIGASIAAFIPGLTLVGVLLSLVTAVLSYFVEAYMCAAEAAFYRDITTFNQAPDAGSTYAC